MTHLYMVQRIGRPRDYADPHRPPYTQGMTTTAPLSEGRERGRLGGVWGHTIEWCRDNDRVNVGLRTILGVVGLR
jgi:hypothetical protein